MIHKTDNVTSLEILSTNEYSISDFTVNDLLTIQVIDNVK